MLFFVPLKELVMCFYSFRNIHLYLNEIVNELHVKLLLACVQLSENCSVYNRLKIVQFTIIKLL